MVKSAKAELRAEAPGATDEGAAALVKAEEAVRGAGDADALALADDGGASFWTARAGDYA